MFNVGDKVMYPMHGAGIISEVEQHEVLGKLKDYYILQMPIGNIIIMMPVGSINELGIRKLISKEEIKDVLESFVSREFIENANWNKRYRENIEKLKSASIYDVADVYKVLAKRDNDKGLSTGERKMFANARQILFSELILSGDMKIEEVEILVKKALEPYIGKTDTGLKVEGL